MLILMARLILNLLLNILWTFKQADLTWSETLWRAIMTMNRKSIHQPNVISSLVFGFFLIALAGCGTTVSESSPALDRSRTLYIMPFANQSNMPMAQSQVEELVASVLSSQGLSVKVYPKNRINDMQASLEPERRQEEARTWLSQQPAGYMVQGAVHEWQYKFGLDGEPAVGITLMISDMNQDELWRGSASRSGWGRESITRIGIKTINDISEEINWR